MSTNQLLIRALLALIAIGLLTGCDPGSKRAFSEQIRKAGNFAQK